MKRFATAVAVIVFSDEVGQNGKTLPALRHSDEM